MHKHISHPPPRSQMLLIKNGCWWIDAERFLCWISFLTSGPLLFQFVSAWVFFTDNKYGHFLANSTRLQVYQFSGPPRGSKTDSDVSARKRWWEAAHRCCACLGSFPSSCRSSSTAPFFCISFESETFSFRFCLTVKWFSSASSPLQFLYIFHDCSCSILSGNFAFLILFYY